MASLLFLGELLIQKNQLLSFSEYLQATILFFLKLKIPTWDSVLEISNSLSYLLTFDPLKSLNLETTAESVLFQKFNSFLNFIKKIRKYG